MPAWMEKLVRGDNKPSIQEKRLDAARSNLLELQFKAKIEDISEVSLPPLHTKKKRKKEDEVLE